MKASKKISISKEERNSTVTYIKKFIFRGLIGVAVGAVISEIVTMIYAFGGMESIASSILIRNFTFSAIIGFYCTGISIVFDVDEWSLLRQTITHFILMTPYFYVAHLAGWMPKVLWGRLLFVAGYLIIYIIIWTSFRNYWRKKAAELNQGLQILREIDFEK